MGEIADSILDFFEADTVFLCRRGRRTPVHPTCKTCHKRNLQWGKIADTKVRYQLQEWDGTPHVCDMSSTMPNLDEEEKS